MSHPQTDQSGLYNCMPSRRCWCRQASNSIRIDGSGNGFCCTALYVPSPLAQRRRGPVPSLYLFPRPLWADSLTAYAPASLHPGVCDAVRPLLTPLVSPRGMRAPYLLCMATSLPHFFISRLQLCDGGGGGGGGLPTFEPFLLEFEFCFWRPVQMTITA